MDVFQMLLLQISAHILTDYTFQSDKKASDKNQNGFKSKFLKWHILIMFLSSWILSLQIKFIFGALVIAVTHWVIDGFKPKLNKGKVLGRYAFFIDQGLHLIIIGIVIFIYSYYFELLTIINLNLNSKYILIAIGYLFCGKPANVFIKEILKTSKIEFDGMNKDDLPNAGRLIGVIERWLVLTFVIINQFSAVGFLIAAKSILRFKDSEKIFGKTEYVLIGTLLSFGIAIAVGVIIDILG